MRLRNGVDVVSLPRFERALARHGGRLQKRLFTAEELRLCAGRAESLAARFAVKEAVAKALGVGMGIISFQEIETLRDENGAPVLKLHGAAAQLASDLRLTDWTVSISHDGGVALVCVIFWGE